MTMSPDELLEEGERLLDANDFAGARDAYRCAAIAGYLSRVALTNLEIATEQERLAFARGSTRVIQRPSKLPLLLPTRLSRSVGSTTPSCFATR